ncbi:hypothetical protein FZC78_19785 [Rossellomorea vietnamensis]|uniref:Uncharacterized protein n=1 Tax=Rossellomorea vietnamensis TaxID=218284 RepID=A0A5D4NLB5_9BACI|nr:hypothetical protein FZC78_19785 [Rossellomorea vietnamensis]
MCLSGLIKALSLLIRPAAAPSPSGSNNLKRIKGKSAFFSLENICLSGLDKALPLLIRPAAAPSPSGSNNLKRIKGKSAFFLLRTFACRG